MSYQALYRKYRPRTLEDVIGQDVVIQILKNAVHNKKICHAYMFSGPRGIGKTTIAKIFAKTVNCLDSKDGDACEKCENCISINSSFCTDIIEIDAASNNGVDEIREIKNNVNLVPNQLKYKVYIIDEVHMLSTGAFNALLKTLEEPPDHIIFILATTDLHKVPSTIISRCQCFDFHRISNPDIVNRLQNICEKETISVENDVLNLIAELSDGGLRDAIGMLDKLNAYSNSNITLLDFEKVNGIVSRDKQIDFLNYVYLKDVALIMKFIDQIYDSGKDLIIFVNNLIHLCKNQSISYYIDGKCDFDINFLISLLDSLNILSKNITFSSNVKTFLEINILSFLNQQEMKNSSGDILDSNKKISQQSTLNKIEKNKLVEQGSELSEDRNVELIQLSADLDKKEKSEKAEKIISREIISVENDKSRADLEKRNKQIINNCFARANKNEKKIFMEKWSQLNDYALDNEFGAAACYISDGTVCVVGEGEVIISFRYESMVNRGFSLLDKIYLLFQKIYGKHYDIALITTQEWDQEKLNFISNKNNGVSYQYIPLVDECVTKENCMIIKSSSSDSITSEAIELFGEDMILIN